MELVRLVYLALFSSDFSVLFIRNAQVFCICCTAIPRSLSSGDFHARSLLSMLAEISWQPWKVSAPWTVEFSYNLLEQNTGLELLASYPEPLCQNPHSKEAWPHPRGCLAKWPLFLVPLENSQARFTNGPGLLEEAFLFSSHPRPSGPPLPPCSL